VSTSDGSGSRDCCNDRGGEGSGGTLSPFDLSFNNPASFRLEIDLRGGLVGCSDVRLEFELELGVDLF